MLPKRFADLREQHNLTQGQLADLLKMSVRAIAAWESGERKPPIDKLEWLADYYGVSTDYLLGRTDVPNMYSHGSIDIQGDSWQIFSNAKDLSPESREQVERQIQGAMEDDQQVILQCSSQDDLEKLVRQIVAQALEERDKQNDGGQ